LIDLCFRGADLAHIKESSPLHSLSLTEPVRFKRYRPDGLVVEWTLRGSKTLRQPFYIQDKTPIEYRIPMGDARTHANGALGILEVRTRECIEVSASNVELKQDPSLQPQVNKCHYVYRSGYDRAHKWSRLLQRQYDLTACVRRGAPELKGCRDTHKPQKTTKDPSQK
jgi:hypothetical protein